ncbi:hypothetical protein Pme01_08700 [Planosporangium mesophilum]|uniref:Uncharacterized protein n=1 Tax=Planosporangium mesophilum TaxID=689768 RepID=A0A8J3X1U9_9ACTN|nr:hypothetical protein Pme01_08700 [Planosporangium mesophilum]
MRREPSHPGSSDYAAYVPYRTEDVDLTPDRTDDRREVTFAEDLVILPDQTGDDTDAGWGEHSGSNDDRLLADRPPHWG